ncbi:uncharacterized protein LOC115634773 isoform X2 [Scaptodrosophila lebanonensis]|uniref:Uncharacterized protein LOC115634773 isoform X2 n=1 Tax=Drosophila lebanonensis TaxID=7225 RepID=A0A6J2UJX7_DROLE|nr:uncharacterized protein LOC115634773 isoform X2 [Scaptodrosophila lebanonensis]
MGTPTSELAMALDIPSPSGVGKGQAQVEFTGTKFEIDSSISEEERRFYHKLFPTVDLVNQRKVHCTVCRTHIGTAPSVEGNIKMHPILRVTHCVKCHDFYNSGEFSKGEDGSELYCRWCGQGGEVYCCSTCPFVFCKSCIIKNLSRGVINDIEQNENWNCFKCTSKILWPLRAQHWALINYIEAQKKGIKSLQLPEAEARSQMMKDNSTCCRLAKSRASGMSDSMESIESNASKRSHSSSVNSTKKPQKTQGPPTKRPKSSNDEVVCTPDLLSMLEPDCQISLPQTTVVRQVTPSANITTTPRIVTVQQNYTGPSSATGTNGGSAATSMPRSNAPPPLVPSSTGIRYRGPNTSSLSVVRRTLVAPMAARNPGPVFHTINGFRVDLNSAAQQESYRLPNGRLIQVKRQVPAASTTPQQPRPITPAPLSVGPQVVLRQRQPLPSAALRQGTNGGYGSNMGIYNPQPNPQPRMPHLVRLNNGAQMQSVPVQVQPQPQPQPQMPGPPNGAPVVLTPVGMRTSTLVRHIFPNDAIGSARTRLQEQIFNAMEICTHLTGKVQTLTNSNAYNSARSYLDLKELYIHLSYLMTYAIGRFKGLQDKCLADMRDLGFKNDANSLENGQLAAAVDYVCYGQLDDVDLFNTGCNSFHNQVYEYRKSLHANLKEGEAEPLPPLLPLGVRAEDDPKDEDEEGENDNENDEPDDYDYDDPEESSAENDDDLDNDDDGFTEYESSLGPNSMLGTEESMNRNEQAHAYDRKLTRLIREYPSIWCTCHPDYGKMEVTKKQWRVIASHFQRGDNIKLRWKNIRKRYVRIERRLKQGKRFKGYFDKATNYLANRDLPCNEWASVDCGEDDGDGFERKELDAIENTIHNSSSSSKSQKDNPHIDFTDVQQVKAPRIPVRPVEVRPIDMRIINFAKSHPVLWRKSADPEFNSIDEQTRKSLWLNFWKSAPNYRCEYIIERWQQMYEMYKSFRLKTIKDKNLFANLELKYSRYLAKLYFLYKIDEQDLRDECEPLLDCVQNGETSPAHSAKLKDMPDDKQFVKQLVLALRAYPTLWNQRHVDYNDVGARERLWPEVARRLPRFKRDARACKMRWQMAKFAYECYCRELERQPTPNEHTLQKLLKNFPLEEMRFLNN